MIIKRVGGKTKIASWITANLPRHNVFVDVFGGSGAVISAMHLESRSCRFVFNDLDSKIYNLFQMMRDHSSELATEISFVPYSRQEFEEAVEILGDKDKFDALSDLDKAVLFLIVNRQSFGAKMLRPWSISIDGEVNYSTWSKLPSYLIQSSKRFKNVYLENLDYRELLTKWDSPETCFYLDPPYEGVEADYYDVNKADGFDHWEMLKALKSIDGSYAVSYYGGETAEEDTPLIKAYAAEGCHILRKQVAKHLSGTEKKATATEVLIVKGLLVRRTMKEIV